MKRHLCNKIDIIAPPAGNPTLAGGCVVAFILALLTSSSFAQSAANFNTQGLAPEVSESAAARPEKTSKPIVKEVSPASTTPSRQIGPAELEAYVTSLASVFSSRERTTDPFGQLQDPDAKPVIKTPIASATKRIAPAQATPFADIIQLITVTTIMPGEKRFLIGTRSIKLGDQIPVSFRGKQMRVLVTDVTSQLIAFKNLDNGETASRKLDMLPVGMNRGNRGISAPGMTLDQPNAPIELETPDTVP
ncbi:MAG: hypothetical protein ACRCXD_03560 [Luteolibacter sp.]